MSFKEIREQAKKVQQESRRLMDMVNADEIYVLLNANCPLGSGVDADTTLLALLKVNDEFHTAVVKSSFAMVETLHELLDARGLDTD